MRRLAALCCCFVLSAQAEVFNAKVIVVMDGDTIMVVREGRGQRLKVRLANIDAPEKTQPFGKQSRDALLEMVGKRRVRIESLAVDQYGRTIGMVKVDGLDVNREQMKRGMAWAYSHYREDKTRIRLQNEAQLGKRGLWVQSSPEAPWLWRKAHPSLHTGNSGMAASAMQHDPDCGNKYLCSQMNSCDEANFYLAHCGVQTLDGNQDGIPCENLCGGK